MKLLAFDSETNGLDFYHGAKPFFVTFCDDQGIQTYYEWRVDPKTRMPEIPESDIDEIEELLASADKLIAQNSKFDVRALSTIRESIAKNWRWEDTYDTLIADHLLYSNQPHDLTALSIKYLNTNIEHYEKKLRKAVLECRHIAKRDYPTWKIAKKGVDGMPSAKDETWKFDTWLPRVVISKWWEESEAGKRWNTVKKGEVQKAWSELPELEGFEFHPPEVDEDTAHHYWTVLSDYANADSQVTVEVFKGQHARLIKRKLEKIYNERLKLLPVVYAMEEYGVTESLENLETIYKQYKVESTEAEKTCVNIAKTYGYELTLPKSSTNHSLSHFCFGEPIEDEEGNLLGTRKYLDLPIVGRTDAGNPSMDVAAIDEWRKVLKPHSKQKVFIDALAAKRKRDKSCEYMDSYRKFWLPTGGNVGRDQTGHIRKECNSCQESDNPCPICEWGASICVNCGGAEVELLGPCPKSSYFRLHPSLNITGTKTTRFSCANPNAQQISKQATQCPKCEGEGCKKCKDTGEDLHSLRKIFGPAPGREWWSMDAQNIELRIPAYESGEQSLIDLFEKPNEPPYYGSEHILNFSVIWPELWAKAIAEVGLKDAAAYCKKKYKSSYYQWIKNGGFAIQFGSIDREDGTGTADKAFHKPGAHAMLRSRFSKKDKLNQKQIAFANKWGYVETIPDKSIDPERGYPLVCTRTDWGKILPTVPLSYHVQGTAGVWMGSGMVRVHEYLKELNRVRKIRTSTNGYRLILTVHDEILLDFPSGNGVEPWKTNLPKIREIQRLMQLGGENIGIPTPTSVEYHAQNWSEGISL